jgi:hypothetical protein
VQAIAHAIRLHEKNQRLFVKHKGVDFLMEIMNKWEEDHDFFFLMLRTLRVRVLRSHYISDDALLPVSLLPVVHFVLCVDERANVCARMRVHSALALEAVLSFHIDL